MVAASVGSVGVARLVILCEFSDSAVFGAAIWFSVDRRTCVSKSLILEAVSEGMSLAASERKVGVPDDDAGDAKTSA